MTRRDFIKWTSAAGALAQPGVTALAAEEEQALLPPTQNAPLPSLGSHWTIFEKLSEQATRPKLSFLNEQFTDHKAWAEQARSTLLTNLHYAPPKCDPKPEVLEQADRGEYIRERISISTTPDIRVPAYVLIPKGLKKPAPAIVALHDHGGFYFWGKEKMVQMDPEHSALTHWKKTLYGGRSVADELAKLGFVVIAPDLLHWGERAMYFDQDPDRIKKRTLDVTQQDIIEFNARSWAHEELVSRTALTCGVTWAGMNIWDDLRVTDYLLTRPEVDPERVGCVGLSLGSVRSIYLGAVHEKVRASVAVCWMASYQSMTKVHIRNGIGFTKLVPGLYTDLDWPDLGGLHLPGALMVINGTKDLMYPFEGKSAVEKIAKIFEKAGKPENYEGLFFDAPHEFNVEMQDRAFDWLKKQLQQV